MKNIKHRKLLIACLMCVFVVALCFGTLLTASAFTISNGWTVIYEDYSPITGQGADLETVTSYTVKGTVNEFGIVVNGQVYGNANVASTLTVNKFIGLTVGESVDDGSHHVITTIYYKLSSDQYFSYANTYTTTIQSTKRITGRPLIITEPGTYTMCIVQEDYYDSDDDSSSFLRSAFLTVIVDPEFTLPVPTKTGYTFNGWYTDSACTQLYEDDVLTSDMVLYAGFRPNNYSVIFNGNGATSGTMTNQSFVYDTAQNLKSNEFTRNGYNFRGWAVSSAMTTVKYTDGQEVNNLVATDNGTITLFALWAPTNFTITFNSNGGTGNMAAQTINWDSATALSTCTFVKEGHIFKGWATSPTGGVAYTDAQTVTNLTSMTLYAVWEPIQCTVTFVVDGKVYGVVTLDWGTSTSELNNYFDSMVFTIEEGQSLPN